MFQVASHPTNFPHRSGMVPSHQLSYAASQSPAAVQLPRHLERPPFRELSRDAIISASPDLGNVPTEYIINVLLDQAPRMLAGNASLPMPSGLTKSRLPPSINVPLRSPTSSSSPNYPTHILAISSSSKGRSGDGHVTLYPIHAIVLASQCTNIPRMPPSRHAHHATSLQIPILSVSVPSPAAFSLIHSYLYTHRLDDLMSSLLPLPPAFTQYLSYEAIESTMASNTKLSKLAHYLCSASSGNVQTLASHAAHVKELWQDCVALGIHTPELWAAIDLAWEIVLGAFNAASH